MLGELVLLGLIPLVFFRKLKKLYFNFRHKMKLNRQAPFKKL